MPEPDFMFEPLGGGAMLFEFDAKRPLDERRAFAAYAGSGVAHWAELRTAKCSELIEPALMYVADDADQHRVAWVKHSGVRENRQDLLVPYSVHHVVCDCAAGDRGNYDQEISTTGFPVTSRTCEVVQNVLEQRAGELAVKHRITDALGAYTRFEGEELDYSLTPAGQEMAIKALAYLMEIDRNHPETWAANQMSGLHEVDLLAAYLGYGTETVMPLLDAMEEGQIVTIRGDEVKLVPQKTPRGVDACSEREIRDALSIALTSRDKIRPEDTVSMLNKLLVARVTQETPTLMAEITDCLGMLGPAE